MSSAQLLISNRVTVGMQVRLHQLGLYWCDLFVIDAVVDRYDTISIIVQQSWNTTRAVAMSLNFALMAMRIPSILPLLCMGRPAGSIAIPLPSSPLPFWQAECRRAALFHYDRENDAILFRHFVPWAIQALQPPKPTRCEFRVDVCWCLIGAISGSEVSVWIEHALFRSFFSGSQQWFIESSEGVGKWRVWWVHLSRMSIDHPESEVVGRRQLGLERGGWTDPWFANWQPLRPYLLVARYGILSGFSMGDWTTFS